MIYSSFIFLYFRSIFVTVPAKPPYKYVTVFLGFKFFLHTGCFGTSIWGLCLQLWRLVWVNSAMEVK